MTRTSPSLPSYSRGPLFASFSGCRILEPQSKSFDQSLTNLEQFQLTSIGTYTGTPGKQWDDAKFRADISTGEAMFTNAMAGVTDQKRLKVNTGLVYGTLRDITKRSFAEEWYDL